MCAALQFNTYEGAKYHVTSKIVIAMLIASTQLVRTNVFARVVMMVMAFIAKVRKITK